MTRKDRKLARRLTKAKRLLMVIMKPGQRAEYIVRTDRFGVRKMSSATAEYILRTEGKLA